MLPYALVTICALGVLLLAEVRGIRSLKWVAKPVASTGFVAAAWALGALDGTYGQILFAALVLCWLGDVLLIPRADLAFRGGLVSFLLGHVALVVAFAVRGVEPLAVLAAAVALMPAIIAALRWLRPHVLPSFRIPVYAYVAAISLMVVVAAGATAAGAGAAVLVGAVLFYVSDLAVARDRFVAPGFDNRLWGLPLYYAATLVLASTAGGA